MLDTTSVNNQLQKKKRLQFCLLSGSLAFGKLRSQYGGQRSGQRHRYRKWLRAAGSGVGGPGSGVRTAVGGTEMDRQSQQHVGHGRTTVAETLGSGHDIGPGDERLFIRAAECTYPAV